MPTERILEFQCNICGRENRSAESEFGREVPSCPGCGSTVRTRALVHMISREIFGVDLPLPEFPALKGLRGLGMSDSSDLADRLGTRFDYRNTHYHKEPSFDVMNPPERDFGAYDFIISSEVFEHVAPPVEVAFTNVFRLLKPHGLFFFTVPYTVEEHTVEHFPELDQYGLAHLGDRIVLVNRTRDGRMQVFEDLVFHGGPGSTLEVRRFSEKDLRACFASAGFREVKLYGQNHPPFGVLHRETWSLPMTGRKDPFVLALGEVAGIVEHAVDLRVRLRKFEREANAYQQWMAWAKDKITQGERELNERTLWAQDLERQFNERTEWAMSLQQDVAHHVTLAKKFQAEAEESAAWATRLQAEIDQLRAQLARIKNSLWTKAGRAAGLVNE
jgi:SAM-dependent methyltransferase